MADARLMRNTRAWNRFFGLPEALNVAVGKQLSIEVDGMVDAMKRAAPVSAEFEKTPGELRDSVHSYANPKRPLSYIIVANARDPKGRPYGRYVEFGHLIPDRGVTAMLAYHAGKNGGSLADARKFRGATQVPAKPFFFPTYRARKLPARRRIMYRARQVIKAASQG
jgi:hypothetical protein